MKGRVKVIGLVVVVLVAALFVGVVSSVTAETAQAPAVDPVQPQGGDISIGTLVEDNLALSDENKVFVQNLAENASDECMFSTNTLINNLLDEVRSSGKVPTFASLVKIATKNMNLLVETQHACSPAFEN